MEVGKLPFNSPLLLVKEFIESIEFMKELIGWSIKDRVHWSQRVHISRVAVLCGWVRLNN